MDLLLYVLLVAAIGAGFLLGRRERKQRPQKAVIKDYYQGLNLLLGERPELGVERFIGAVQVNDDSIDVHLALAGVVRRRGEVDKAIRIHQNLLAAPALSNANKSLTELELARDYYQAGLLDRAENLLRQISARRGAHQDAALQLLLDLYEQERDWPRAIEVALQRGRYQTETRVRLCHFYCELAELALRDQDWRKASQQAVKAVEFDANQPRGYIVGARAAFAGRQFKQVLKALQKATDLAPELVGEYLDIYRKACESMSKEEAFERFLRRCLTVHPDATVLRALIDWHRRRGQPLDPLEIVEQIERAPDLSHVSLLLELGRHHDDDTLRHTLWQCIQDIVAQDLRYQCGVCGFTASQHLWHCPACKNWGSFRVGARLTAASSQSGLTD